ncbi:uncharacterized protein LAJ45_02387 [Morchella importuna]|uniref:uncharacterized protein n=1 Tax=Morchella importuna TaxID=1174673 RepID=UPI001E8CBCDB|nr:uncharacterized protein LAJ45_02387 [Morchella importuna]KAH8153574.1 hypothetical protein LAJ45_02387 [Morchella importuna]
MRKIIFPNKPYFQRYRGILAEACMIPGKLGKGSQLQGAENAEAHMWHLQVNPSAWPSRVGPFCLRFHLSPVLSARRSGF